MAEPQLIIVDGIPVKSHVEVTQKWTLALFFINLIYFIYQCNIYHEQNRLLAISFSFVIGGVYLPLQGYVAVQKNNQNMIRFFSIILCMISLFGIVSALSSISFYYEISSLCDNCTFVDSDCYVRVTDEELYITKDECTSLPPETTFLVEHLLELSVGVVGIITACMVTPTRKHVEGVAVFQVPEEDTPDPV